MIDIRSIKDIREKLNIHEMDEKLLLDLVRMLILLDTEFGASDINKLVILDSNEEYKEPHPYPEVDEIVGTYNKKIYIVSDIGEGVVIYKKVDALDA